MRMASVFASRLTGGIQVPSGQFRCRVHAYPLVLRRGCCGIGLGLAQIANVAEEQQGIDMIEQKRLPHTPVLLNQVLTQFEGRSLRSFIDCTLGAGGHASAIINSHPELQHFVGLDMDREAIAEARTKLNATSSSDLQLHLVHSNFRNLRSVLEQLDLAGGVDGILMDLGVSSMQVDSPERGFSYYLDGPLDMRMDPSARCKATTILDDWPEAEIGRVLRDYGEERRWKFLARRIVDARLSGGVKSTAELVKLIGGRFCSGKNKKMKHPAMRTFQALRIAVNDELKSLEVALSQAVSCLAPGGRLAVVSFHSLEDRIVKHGFLSLVRGPDAPAFKLLTKKPMISESAELEKNPRSRSAKLRVIERLSTPSNPEREMTKSASNREIINTK